MKFNVYFTLLGPTGQPTEVPNKGNPIESPSLGSVLGKLAVSLPPLPAGVMVVGARIEQAMVAEDKKDGS